MPRKKEFKLEDKLYLPGCDELIKGLIDHKNPALRPTTIAKLQKWDFTPLWDYTDRETLIVFTHWLLRSPIFKQGRDGIRLHYPGSRTITRKEITPANVVLLLLGLSGELANYFLSQKSKVQNYKHLMKPLSMIKDLKNYKSVLIISGIVRKEDTFDEVYVKMGEWMLKLATWSLERMPPSRKEELVVLLYPYFKNLASLPDINIYRFIAHIIKHLGTEKGDVRNISMRIRKRLERKGIKKELVEKGLDVERLRKTLSHLTHLPL